MNVKLSGPIQGDTAGHNQAQSTDAERSRAAHTPTRDASTPPTDRGVEIGKLPQGASIGLHWASLTLRQSPTPTHTPGPTPEGHSPDCLVQRVTEVISSLLPGVVWVPCNKPAQGYRRMILCSIPGVRIFRDPLDGSGHIHVRMTGEVCEAIGVSGVLAVAAVGECSPTRLDFALDVVHPDCPSPAAIYDEFAADRSRFRTYLKSATLMRSTDGGSTCYLGSRESETYVRIYDRRDTGQRFEVELKGARALAAFQALRAAGDAAGAVMVAHVRRAVDFVQAVADAVTRAPLQAWWADVVGSFSVAPVVPAVMRTIERAREWVRRSCAGTFKGLLMAFGGDLGALLPDDARIPPWLSVELQARAALGLSPGTAPGAA